MASITSLFFQIASIFYIILIGVAYFCKKKVDTFFLNNIKIITNLF